MITIFIVTDLKWKQQQRLVTGQDRNTVTEGCNKDWSLVKTAVTVKVAIKSGVKRATKLSLF